MELNSVNNLIRRTSIIDNFVNVKLNDYIKDVNNKTNPHITKREFKNGESFVNWLIDQVLKDLHGDYFVYSEISNEEWDKVVKFVSEYIRKTHMKKILITYFSK